MLERKMGRWQARRMSVWAVANQKGGVGKTTVTLFLAEALANLGHKVLVVDLDPQASASKVLGADTASLPTVADLLLGEEGHSVTEVAVDTDWGFSLAPSEVALAARDAQRRLGDEFILRHTLTETSAYDVVLVDCPPSLGVLTVNALSAADHLLVVTEPSFVTLQAVNELLTTVGLVRKHYNSDLAFSGVVVNLMDHTREARARAAEVEAFFEPGLVWAPYVPRRTAMREAASRGVGLAAMGKSAAELAPIFASLAAQVVARG